MLVVLLTLTRERGELSWVILSQLHPLNVRLTLLNVPSIVHSTQFLRIGSNEVIIQLIKLIKTKCFSVLYYGLQDCPLRTSQYNSIDYVINSLFRKVVDTKSQEVIDVCLGTYNCLPAQQVIAIRKHIFPKYSVPSTMYWFTYVQIMHKRGLLCSSSVAK